MKISVNSDTWIKVGNRIPRTAKDDPLVYIRTDRPIAAMNRNVPSPALSRLFGIPDLRLDTRLTSILAFVYTYHYLNWFIKADVIRWADIPRMRLVGLAAASAASTALYFYDYTFGFTFLLALSLVHILLEFPLNSMALRQLGAALGGTVMRRSGEIKPAKVAPRSRRERSTASKPAKP